MVRAVRLGPILAIVAMAGLVGLVPSVAPAQTPGPQPASSPAAPAATDAPAAAPAGSDATPLKPVVPATGYGWSTHPAVRGRGRPRAARATTPASSSPNGTVVPGFETLADGSSRVFVQLPKPVTYSAKAARGSVTYVLKGVHADRRNNLNALVTVHFNTPVTSAKLVPHGGDLWLCVNLRASVQPSVTMDATKDGGAMLRIEFPKGDYLSGASAVPATSPATASSAAPASSAPAPASFPAATAPAPSSSAYSPGGL
jgi:hypothetical protein